MIIDTRSNSKIHPFVKSLNEEEIERLNVTKENGWKLDWKEPFVNDCTVYGMFASPLSNQLEGLVAFTPIIGSLEMYQLESASHNQYYFLNRIYKGVGKHLTAFGCDLSEKMAVAFPTRGFLSAYSKPNAREFYLKINATEAECDYWLIDPIVGEQLIMDCYIRRESLK